METKKYYTDRKTTELAIYLAKHKVPFYFDGRIIEFESTPARVEAMQKSNSELALIPFVVR